MTTEIERGHRLHCSYTRLRYPFSLAIACRC